MTILTNFLGMLAFRAGSLRAQGERRALVSGVIIFAVGFVAFVLVRNSISSDEFLSARSSQVSSLLGFNLIHAGLNLAQTILYLMLAYIPAVIILSNAISGDGLGLSFSRQEYETHVSALLPLWGMLHLILTPLQWFVPPPGTVESLESGVVEISVGRLIPILIYTVWSIKQLNYLSWMQAFGVFILSCFTLPLYYLLTSFLFALPLFFMIPLIYMGYQWIRGHLSSQTGERAFQRNLHTLTLNPQDADAHYQLGLIHLKRRNLDAARRYFESALKIDPRDPDYHYFFGRAFEAKGDWARALEQYEETYRLNPEYGLGDIFREVGKGYLLTGNVEKGMEFLKFFLAKRGSDPEGRYWLAVAMQKVGDSGQMRAQLAIIVEQARSNPRFFRKENREWIYRARKMIRDS